MNEQERAAGARCTCPPPEAGGVVGVNRGHLLDCPELLPASLADIQRRAAAMTVDGEDRGANGQPCDGWGFTAEAEAELADIMAVARLAGMIPGTRRFSRAILAAGYRRTEQPSPRWELRKDFDDQDTPP